MIIPVKTSQGYYDIVLEKGALSNLNSYLNLDRNVLIVSDSGVPKEYFDIVAKQCKNAVPFVFVEGEASKNLDNFKKAISIMIENKFSRKDCVLALGGGVVGDLAGFVAASYMRGVDFYNIPTTVLSQVDSSIGGKVAVDFDGYKNLVGAFYPPKAVVIDFDTLKTLPERQISNGLAEALKMSLTSDSELFDIFENCDIDANIDKIIEKSILIKKAVVEADEKEMGLRKILNFGHTLGHAIETQLNMEELYHGECVAIGMVPMCSKEVRPRLIKVLKKLNLPFETNLEKAKIAEALLHDKKSEGSDITITFVDKIGEFKLEKMSFTKLEEVIFS